jgi:hypothetical protein
MGVFPSKEKTADPIADVSSPLALPNVDLAAGGMAADPAELVWSEPEPDIPYQSCPTCGGSELWETLAATWRCQHCDSEALTRSRWLLRTAARLRRRDTLRIEARRRWQEARSLVAPIIGKINNEVR